MDIFQALEEAAAYLTIPKPDQPTVGLILGTGLGGVAELCSVKSEILYEKIPHFPKPTVEGHKGSLIFGAFEGTNIIAMQGRFHYYEGLPLSLVTFPVRLMRRLGAEYLVISSAAGGLNPAFRPGGLMIIVDHLNLMGDNPLRGVTDPRLGDRFPDLSAPYNFEMTQFAKESAAKLGHTLHEGVYAAVSGPSLETRAETRMLRMLGADAVGMSTVPEVIVANQVGLKTLAIAAITNVNIPEAPEAVTLQQVIDNAKLAEAALQSIISDVLRKIAEKYV